MEQYSTATVNTESNLFELQIDHEISSHLSQTAKWAKFLAIVGFVFCGLITLVVVFAGSWVATISPLGGTMGAAGFMQVVLMLMMVGLYFFPCLFLFNFSNKMLLALRNNDQNSLITSFRQLKLCFKFVGILTIIFLSIYLVIFVFAGLIFAMR